MDVEALLAAVGPWALVVIAGFVFIESGLLLPFLPGDSLLVTAGPFITDDIDVLLTVIVLVSILPVVIGRIRRQAKARRAA
jgi:membrane-associated protein